MPRFMVNEPVDAQQYVGPESVVVIAELVRRYRPGASYDNAVGVLRFYNSGTDLRLEISDWAVIVGGDVVIMKPSMFERWTTAMT